jgi:hypothetical protein
MEIIDEEGDLLGLINVIDAFLIVILLVGAAGGFVLVSGGLTDDSAPNNLPTRYATIDLGPQPDYLISEISENDSYSPNTHTQLTITDVHLSPQGDQTRVVLQTEIQGPAAGETISYDRAPLRLGRSLTIRTDTYSVSGTVRDVDSTKSFSESRTSVLLRGRGSATNITTIAAGDEIRIGNQTVATVEDVITYGTGDSDTRIAYVAATLNTYSIAGNPHFGGTKIQNGVEINLPTSESSIPLTVLERDSSLAITSSQVVVSTSVTRGVARHINLGDRFRVGGRDIATVETVQIYGTDDSDRKKVFLGLSLATVTHQQSSRFGDTVIREGANIPFKTDDYVLNGDVRRVGSVERRGDPQMRTVMLRLDNAEPQLAESIHEGLTETAAGDTIARIGSVERTSETVVLTSQDGDIYQREHPVNKELMLNASLSVYERETGITFKDQTITHGSTITLDLGTVTIQVTVVNIDS